MKAKRVTDKISPGGIDIPVVVVTVDSGQSFTFDHDPTDDEIQAAFPDEWVEVEPSAASGRQRILRDALDAAVVAHAAKWLNDTALLPATGANAAQKAGTALLAQRTLQKALRLARAYNDAGP